MLELEVATEDVGSARGNIGIVRDNQGKFTDELDTGTLLRIETIASSQMAVSGYRPVNETGREKRLGVIEDLFYRGTDYLKILNRERQIRGTFATARSFVWNRLRKR